MKLGMDSSDWGTQPDVRQMFRELQETGWDGCEMRLSLDWMGTPGRMKALLKETGFTISCLATKTSTAHVDDPMTEMIMRRIEYADAIDVRDVMMFPPARPKGRAPTMEEYDRFAEVAEQLAGYAAGFGIAFSFHHHSHGLVEGIREVEIILEQTRQLKLVLDIYHSTIMGDDFVEAFGRLRDRVHYVHVHDGSGIKLLDLGEGTIDIASCLEALKASGYDGWVVGHGGHTDRTPLEKARVCRACLRSMGC